jgi:hypothetical protein
MIGVLREASTAFDPVLARLFASAMGVFPVGCVVRLADDSVGVVREPTDDPLVPRVRLVYDSRGLELSTPYDVTLGAADVRIVEVIDPDSLAVQVADRL